MKEPSNHISVYQNFAYQYWQREYKTKENSKISFSMSLNLPNLISLTEDNITDPKRRQSDLVINSQPKLKPKAANFFSSKSLFDSNHVLPSNTDSSMSNEMGTPVHKPSNKSDRISRMKNFKPFIPKSHSYSTTNVNFLMNPSPFAVFPQSYTPVYIPIINLSYCPIGIPSELLSGEMKFFDENQNYGFFTIDSTGEDLFVHYDDLAKTGITKDCIKLTKIKEIKFSFRCLCYYGKYDLSYKAVDIHLLTDIKKLRTNSSNQIGIV